MCNIIVVLTFLSLDSTVSSTLIPVKSKRDVQILATEINKDQFRAAALSRGMAKIKIHSVFELDSSFPCN